MAITSPYLSSMCCLLYRLPTEAESIQPRKRQRIPRFGDAYEQVLPSKRHRAVVKDTGLTSYIERLNNT